MIYLSAVSFLIGFGFIRMAAWSDQTAERTGTDGYSIVRVFKNDADADQAWLHTRNMAIGWAIIGFSIGVLFASSM